MILAVVQPLLPLAGMVAPPLRGRLVVLAVDHVEDDRGRVRELRDRPFECATRERRVVEGNEYAFGHTRSVGAVDELV